MATMARMSLEEGSFHSLRDPEKRIPKRTAKRYNEHIRGRDDDWFPSRQTIAIIQSWSCSRVAFHSQMHSPSRIPTSCIPSDSLLPYRHSLLDNHLYSIFSILPDSIFHIPSLTPQFSSSITFSFLIVIWLRHTINANAISVETPYDALSSPKMFQNRTHCHGPNPISFFYSLL